VIPSYISKDIFAVLARHVILFVFILSLCLTTTGTAQALMSQLNDEALMGISGQAGLSIVLDGSAQVHYDLFKFSDTQATPNWIELKNFNINGAGGGAFSFATLGADVDNPAVFEPNTIDVATDSNGQTFVSMLDTSNMNPRWYSVGDIELKYYDGSAYQEQSLGSINLDALSQGPSVYNLWAHAASGISFNYTTAISASALTYTYNTAPTTLSLTGIHIVGSATGGSDDPANPATWVFGGTSNFFKIGTIGDVSNTSATVDVATDSTGTSIFLSLPMAGTIRVADVTFGGQSFGPIAIDGIQIHRLNVKISGGL
jgi:hypothetical protein